MRAVLDPNILIAALLSPGGAPAQIVSRWLGGEFELVVSEALLSALERALAYGESLFSTHQTVVISTDFIKSPRHRDDFIDHCPDLVIVDEAHTCVPAEGAGTSSRSAQLR